MALQVIEDRVDLLHFGRQPGLHLLQERQPVRRRAAGVRLGEGGSGGGQEGAEDVAFAPPAVVGFVLRPARRQDLGAVSQVSGHPRRPGISLGGERSQLVQADDYTPFRRLRVKPLDLPLFSANSGSTRRGGASVGASEAAKSAVA